MKNKSTLDSTNLVIAVVAFSQGVLGLSDLAISFMQKENYQMQPSQMTYIQGIISFPWVIKPLWGLCTDMFPIFGYRRKSYLFIFGMLQFILWNLLALYGLNSELIGVGILVAIQVCVSFCNVVGEALLVQASTDDSDKATRNVSLFFGIKAFGTLITAYFSGYSLKYLVKEQIFQITSLFPLMMAIIALQLTEDKVTIVKRLRKQAAHNQIDKKESFKELMLFLNNPTIYNTAMFYYYTTELGFTADFLGKLKFFQASGHIFSIIFFNQRLKHIPFRRIFAYSTFAYFLCSLLSLMLVTRQNVKYGLPDKPFCLTDTVLVHIVGELNTLPILILACKICPPHIEGTMYALLMSTINLAQLLGKQIGGILMFTLGINDNAFGNLWILVLIHTVYILLPLPFLFTIKEDEMMKLKQVEMHPDSPQQYVERYSSYERLSLSVINNEQSNSTNEEELDNLLADI